MSEWKECKLGDVTSKIGSGSTPRGGSGVYKESGMPFIRSQNIHDLKFSDDGLVFIDETQAKELNNVEVKIDDIFINITGDSVARVCKIPPRFIPARVNQHVAILRSESNKLNSDFLKYSLISMKEYLFAISEIGGTRRAITKGMLESLPILLPPLAEQKAIAGVLSALDDKIDLLHRQNKTLEAMAEALFRQWFVEEADETWEEGKLGDLVEVRRGGSPRPIQDYLSDSGLHWLKISDVTGLNSPFIFEIKEFIKIEGLKKTVLLQKGSLVVSNSATPGIPKILAIKSCIHDGWLYFPKSELSNEFLYFFFLMIKKELVSQGNGSIFTNLKTDLVREFKLKLPPKFARDSFDTIVKPYFEKQYSNAVQIRSLEKLRDTLLPKLMSGEVRVGVK
jgi:type I restriction enzyme S subunit